MSTFNGAAFLEAQLDSLRAQEEVKVSLHVRDDGSSDGTVRLLRAQAATWPNLCALESGANLGPPASFLDLLRTAPDDVEYYAFCDQDDVWLPGKLARAVAALSGETAPALYCSNVTCVAEDLHVLGIPDENGDTRLQHLLFENIAYGCTVVMNRAARSLIASRLPLDNVVMHDWWCALVIAAMGRVHYDPQPHILYRQHQANSIGMIANGPAQMAWRLCRFLSGPRSRYRVHRQATELLRLYEADLDEPQRAAIGRLVNSKRSWLARLAYALSGQIVRRRLVDAIVARGLVATGWY